MSTAEQVARAFIGADALAGIGYEHDLEVATKAIEFDRAVHDVAHIAQHLLEDLETQAQPRDRETEAEKARVRNAQRFGVRA